MIQWVFTGVLGVAFLVYCRFLSKKNSKALAAQRSAFAAREQADVAAWFDRYFADTGLPSGELTRILQPIAQAMKCSVTQLRPNDSFTGTLAFRGAAFLGSVADDDPLQDYAEHDLPRLLGNDERAASVVDGIQEEPTLHALARAVATTQ